jgi:hypothetical protein
MHAVSLRVLSRIMTVEAETCLWSSGQCTEFDVIVELIRAGKVMIWLETKPDSQRRRGDPAELPDEGYGGSSRLVGE